MAIKFENVEEEKQFTEAEKIGVGTHLVKITKVIDKDTFVDKNGNPYWGIAFQNKDGAEHFETFFWGGSMAHKTARLLRAIGELEADEKIETCKKSFEKEDFEGAKLNITIEEDKNATNEKYKFKIASDGFQAIAGASKPAKKAEPVEDPF